MKKFLETSGTSDCALCTISSLGKLESKFDQNFWQKRGQDFPQSRYGNFPLNLAASQDFDKIFLF